MLSLDETMAKLASRSLPSLLDPCEMRYSRIVSPRAHSNLAEPRLCIDDRFRCQRP